MTKRRQFQYFRDLGSTLKDISRIMNISIITAKRWNKELKNRTLIREHGLKNKKSNFSSNMNRNKILNDYLSLAKEISSDNRAEPYNFSYYVEFKLKDKCSLSTFRNIMKENYIASPWANRKTKKFYNKILKNEKKNKVLSKERIDQIKTIIDLNDKIYYRKSRPEHAGEIAEIDASKDYWLGPIQSHLHAIYDPATRTILSLHLEKEETTKGYFLAFKPLIKNGLISRLYKGDCRSSFVINKKNAGALAHKDVNTQFGFMLNILGAKMENSSEPTFKGAIERFFRTAQNQLKGEFRERNINTFDEANKYLKKYIKQFNNRYSIKPKKEESYFLKRDLSSSEINDLLSIRTFRKTDKANSISYNNILYSLYDQNNNRVSFKEKSAILILKDLSNNISAKYLGETLKLIETDF